MKLKNWKQYSWLRNFRCMTIYVRIFLPLFCFVPFVLVSTSLGKSISYHTIQILSSSDKESAENLFDTLSKTLPDEGLNKLRLIYLEPYFHIRVGIFPDAESARSTLGLVQKNVPEAILIMESEQESVIKIIQEKQLPGIDLSGKSLPSSPIRKIQEDSTKFEGRSFLATEIPAVDRQTLVSQGDMGFYTLQVGSFRHQGDAETYYEQLLQILPKRDLHFMRVEHVGSFYTVRMGKFDSNHEASLFFSRLGDSVPNAVVMHAYIKNERIKKLYLLKEAITDKPVGKINRQPPVEISEMEAIDRQSLVSQGDIGFYTIQVGSYRHQKDAETYYEQLLKIFSERDLHLMRIEHVGSFYTVRMGKFDSNHEASLFLERLGDSVPNAIVLHAYIKNERIKKLYLLRKTVAEVPAKKIDISPPAPVSEIPEKQPPEKEVAEEITEELLPMKPTAKELVQEYVKTEIRRLPKVEKEKPVVKLDEPKKVEESQQIVVSSTPSGTCTTSACHGNLKQAEKLHLPVKQGTCLSCHIQENSEHPDQSGSDFRLMAKGAALCYSCHDSLDEKMVIHSPISEGDCLACHNPHGASGPFLLNVGENQKDLCLTCHESTEFEQEFGHGPVELGVCTFCHDPHQADIPGLFRENAQDVCISCHDDFGQGMQQAAFIHPAIQELSCVGCHFAHGSERAGLLKQEGEELCFGCHEEIENKYVTSKSRHGALYIDKGCENCHFVHYSDYENLLYNEELNICLDCHGQDNYSKSKKLRNIKREIDGKTYLHGPLAEAQCSSCHDPHGTDFPDLLVSSYPSAFYAAYSPGRYNFCFQCHEAGILEKPETTELTSFRNGALNLHYLHVVREKKGRTCQSCHQSHASDGKKLISSTGAQFGSWQIPLRFTISERGGSCVPGCHRQMDYDREQPVDYKNQE